MSSYVQEKVIEAVKKSKGTHSAAKRALANLAARDERFLRELFGPHIAAILEHAIKHYTHSALMDMKPANAAEAKEPLGKDMLKLFAGQNTPVFGIDDPSQGTGRRPAASPRHKEAISKIAKRVDPSQVVRSTTTYE